MIFSPLVGGRRPWPAGQPWIFPEPRGSWYTPATALAALRGILVQKTTHYPRFSRTTRLVIYYGKAVMYNTPYVGVETRDFADVAALAADSVREQATFEKIYLLNALEPELEAFELYPVCARCA